MQKIVDCLDKEIIGESLSVDDIKAFLPEGWWGIAFEMWYLTDLVRGRIERVAVEKGLLRFTATSDAMSSEGVVEGALLRRLSQSIARDSSLKCMKCGKRGFRRKIEEGWPSLCGVHYVEYVNFLDQNKE